MTPTERDALILQWAPLVHREARNFHRSLRGIVDLDDLVAIGMWALWEAAQSYDETRASFYTHAVTLIRHRFCWELQHYGRDKRLGMRRTDTLDDPDSPIWLEGAGASPELSAGSLELYRKMRDAVDALPEAQRKVLLMRMRGISLESIGRRIGCTKQWAGQLQASAIARLRVALVAEEIDAAKPQKAKPPLRITERGSDVECKN